jgi:ABC-type polysaccharide/polyol phosphate export permease
VGIPLTPHALWMVPLVAMFVIFASGLAFLAAYLGAFFADTMNVTSVLLRLLMYLSPTFYYARGEHGLIPERYQALYMANPVACFFEAFRDALLWGRMPDPWLVLYAGAVSAVVFCVGFAVFAAGEGRFAKYV